MRYLQAIGGGTEHAAVDLAATFGCGSAADHALVRGTAPSRNDAMSSYCASGA